MAFETPCSLMQMPAEIIQQILFPCFVITALGT